MHETVYYTYIMASRSHNFYVGVTSEIEIRVEQHKQGRFDGYSKRYNCNRLVWFERFTYVGDAIAREKQLKGWSRAKKIWLIERENPTWVDLSEEWGKPVKMFSVGGRWWREGRTADPSTAPVGLTSDATVVRVGYWVPFWG
jgi:putative endonuclease